MTSLASAAGSAWSDGPDGAAWVLGIDVGGTGSRAALAPVDPGAVDAAGPRLLDGARVAVASAGSSAPEVAAALIRAARLEWPDAALAGVAVGATGLASLVGAHGEALAMLAEAAGGRVPVALAIDAVTAHLGALGGRGGAVVAVGTGAIAVGTDLRSEFVRVGGWGHLYDDAGSGAWIGIEGLRAAIRTHDGVTTNAAALLAAAVARFGPAPSWPGQLLTRADRAGLLAGFAADVAALSAAGDGVASDIMARAGVEVAATLVAALRPGIPPVASWTGGVFGAGGGFTAAFEREFGRLAPGAALLAPVGTPLDGAVRLARLTAAGAVPALHPPYLWSNASR